MHLNPPIEFLESLDVPVLVRTTLVAQPELLAWLQREMAQSDVQVPQEWNCFRLLLDNFTVCVLGRDGNVSSFPSLPADFVPNWLEVQIDEVTVLFAVHGTVLINRLSQFQVPQEVSQAMMRSLQQIGEETVFPGGNLTIIERGGLWT